MKLSDKQFLFAKNVTLLFMWLIEHGYKFTLGDAYRKGDRRLHGKRLAIDLNLFVPEYADYDEYKNIVTGYRYTRYTKDHRPAGEFWESLGGCWGGRFKKKDGNHYSWPHGGMKQ